VLRRETIEEGEVRDVASVHVPARDRDRLALLVLPALDGDYAILKGEPLDGARVREEDLPAVRDVPLDRIDDLRLDVRGQRAQRPQRAGGIRPAPLRARPIGRVLRSLEVVVLELELPGLVRG
jgi:hypothetical protein